VQRIIRAYEEFDQSRSPEARPDRGSPNHEG
jgi:hypothetical protein